MSIDLTQLEQSVCQWTGRRVRGLEIEMLPERVILRGRATTFHIKQLAQHGVRQVLPHVRLENAIIVESN